MAPALLMGHCAAVAGIAVLMLGAALALPSTTLARTPNGPLASAPGYMVPLYAGKTTQTFRPIPAPSRALANGTTFNTLSPTSTIQVTYHGFTTKAKAAFQAAVNVWQSIVVSDQVIHVDASWTNLGSATGILGQAGANDIFLEGDGSWYPGPLEDARCHCNAASTPEISADFNSAFPDWYKGTDGNVPNGKWDLETVVLHELGHGLGFFSSFRDPTNGPNASWGYSNGTNHPMVFDRNEWDSSSGGLQLISGYANGSPQLKAQLTDKSVYLGGSHLGALLGGRARLYAPSSWQEGSSNSHLDENTYAPGTINALMTPILSDGEAIHDPGPIAEAILQDIGWTLASAMTAPGAPQSVIATAGDTSADVSWSAPASNGGSTITGYTATSSPDGVTCTTGGTLSCTVNGLTNGVQYAFTVAATNGVGTGPSSAPSNPVVPHAASSDVSGPVVGAPVVNIVAPQTMSTTASIHISWPDATDDSGIASYELQRQAGAGPWSAVSLATATSTSADMAVTRGSNYSFRVRATDGVGNVGDWIGTTSAHMTTDQETSASIVYSGTWTRSAVSGAAGGYVFQSSLTNDSATFSFTGTSVALVTTLAPGRGIAEITLDGSDVVLVDLYSPTKKTKQVVWAPDSALSAGLHTVAVRVTGTKNPSATGARVDVDAFLTWP